MGFFLKRNCFFNIVLNTKKDQLSVSHVLESSCEEYSEDKWVNYMHAYLCKGGVPELFLRMRVTGDVERCLLSVAHGWATASCRLPQ